MYLPVMVLYLTLHSALGQQQNQTELTVKPQLRSSIKMHNSKINFKMVLNYSVFLLSKAVIWVLHDLKTKSIMKNIDVSPV